MLVRLSCAPVVSIISIHGRATGVGSELDFGWIKWKKDETLLIDPFYFV
jgi:hypothetical protein